MTINEMIEKYNIYLAHGDNDGHIGIRNSDEAKRDNAVSEIAQHKAEIMAVLQQAEDEKKQRYAEYCSKIDAIEGMQELEAAIDEWDAYHAAVRESIDGESEDVVRPTPKPESSIEELLKKYPRAAAYHTAKSYSLADHYMKSTLGKEAVDQIINGEDFEAAISEMKTAWTNYCEDHIND